MNRYNKAGGDEEFYLTGFNNEISNEIANRPRELFHRGRFCSQQPSCYAAGLPTIGSYRVKKWITPG